MVDKALLANETDMGQVLGGLLLNGELLYDTSYQLKAKDFIREYALVFSCANNLIRQGIRQFDDELVLDYIENHYPKYADVYKELHPDRDFVKTLQESARLFNFEYHYNNVKKMAYLRDLNEKRYDISWLYDVEDEEAKINKDFDKMTLDDIISKVRVDFNELHQDWVIGSSEDESLSSETVTDEELDDALEGDMEVGHRFPIGLEVLTHIYRGQLPQKYHLNMAGSGVGKIKSFIEKYLLNRKLGVI